jgi:signal transduction histidine kinase
MRSLMIIGLFAAALAACSPPAPKTETPAADIAPAPVAAAVPAVSDGWAAVTPDGAKVGAGYMRIVNPGGVADKLVSVASARAGKVEIHPAPMDVENLLRQVAELMSPRAHEKGIEIAWAAAPRLGLVKGDEGRLRQVLLNYVGNAVKFTESGGVLLAAEPDGAGGVKFTVSDSGPGVPAAVRPPVSNSGTTRVKTRAGSN